MDRIRGVHLEFNFKKCAIYTLCEYGPNWWLGVAERQQVTQERRCMASRPGSGVSVGDTGALIGRRSEMPEDAAVARILAVSHGAIDQSEGSNWRE